MRKLLIPAGLLLLGCRPTTPPPAPPTPAPPTPRLVAATKPATRPHNDLPRTMAVAMPNVVARRIGAAPKDPPAPIQLATRFEIYDITLPLGAVSRSEPFWKLIDEEQIDPGTYDVLRRNGVRVGVAPVTEWTALRALIADLPATTQVTSVTGREATNAELPMKREVLSQSIFVFHPNGALTGRTYEKCDNFLALSFLQTPRKAGQLRLAMSPLVRSTRKHLEYTTLGNEREFVYTHWEKALDVNLRVEIPLDHMLVVAPSEEARTGSSLGNAFLVHSAPAEMQERVLVMVPRMFRIESEPSAGRK